MPRGASHATGTWGLLSEGGIAVPLQTRVLDRWADGSIRWVLLDFQASIETGTPSAYILATDVGVPAVHDSALSSTVLPDTVDIDTGAARFRLRTAAPILFDTVEIAGRALLDGRSSGLRFLDAGGRDVSVTWASLLVEEAGPLRTVLRAHGTAKGRGFLLDIIARLHFYAGLGTVRLLLTVRNPRRARHPGGFWELGDRGSVLIQELAVVLHRVPASSEILFSCERDHGLTAGGPNVAIYQDSSGGENWNSTVHVNRQGVVPNRFRGYRVTGGDQRRDGLRASPIVLTQASEGTLGACIPDFWQNFPRLLSGSREEVTVSFWPSEYGDVHELQGGEQKTHEAWLVFGDDAVSEAPLSWCRDRLLAHATPEWYAATEAVAHLTPATSDPNEQYLKLVNSAVDGPETFIRKRERIDEYGWRHFGDIYADHEAALHSGPSALVSHYNNQYDVTAGFAVHFMRTGDHRWWDQMDQLARHVIDIDIYHTDEDKTAYNHGLFWHTSHYVDAGKATHRSYPRHPNVPGGGPCGEHDYSAGLMLHYFLTGSEQSRDAALELAQWVIDMDDGRKTIFRWLDRGYTGLASATGSPDYHGPGRGSGNSIQTLLNAHTLTGDTAYLDKAEQLIRRCIHPQDDIPALNLLDAERRWYYNVFLQVLGRYLHFKAERGQFDRMHAYARASLLHYATWMGQNEYPYLEKPEILEYPNETWAAQDMRKSEVFMHAALHSHGEERRQFEERAAHFFEYSTSTLARMPTHALARPTVLMLVNAYMRAWFEAKGTSCKPVPAALESRGFDAPQAFVPQKARATRRALALAGAAAVVGVFALARWMMP